MTNEKPIIVGAVLYDPKVSVIWDIIRDFFEDNGCPMDVVFYTNYELQNQGLISGHLDIAWNSPLASTRRPSASCTPGSSRPSSPNRINLMR